MTARTNITIIIKTDDLEARVDRKAEADLTRTIIEIIKRR